MLYNAKNNNHCIDLIGLLLKHNAQRKRNPVDSKGL